jgi:predicted phage tail protein
MSAQEIRLTGVLGKRYGRLHQVHLETKTPAEAMRWLLANFPDARSFFAGAAEHGMEFALFRGRGKYRENIGPEQIGEPGGDRITISPVIAGAKSGGVLTTILGVVLIALSFVPGLQAFSPALMTTGIGLVAGGVVQLLSPQPKLNKQGDAADNQSSYVFNGAVNTTAQGGCVPVLYGGPMEIGSVVLSAGIDAVDYSSRPSNVGIGKAGGNWKTSPYEDDPA